MKLIRRERNVKATWRFAGFEHGAVVFFVWLMAAVISAAPDVAQDMGDVFRDCDVCPEMVVVPAGSFMMGGATPLSRTVGFCG